MNSFYCDYCGGQVRVGPQDHMCLPRALMEIDAIKADFKETLALRHARIDTLTTENGRLKSEESRWIGEYHGAMEENKDLRSEGEMLRSVLNEAGVTIKEVNKGIRWTIRNTSPMAGVVSGRRDHD